MSKRTKVAEDLRTLTENGQFRIYKSMSGALRSLARTIAMSVESGSITAKEGAFRLIEVQNMQDAVQDYIEELLCGVKFTTLPVALYVKAESPDANGVSMETTTSTLPSYILLDKIYSSWDKRPRTAEECREYLKMFGVTFVEK